MIVPQTAVAAGTPTARPKPSQLTVDPSLEGQVQNALNLYLPLKTPAQMPALLATLQAAAPTVHDALESLHYVHFARFLPSPDGSLLWVITTYDGGLDAYIMDFVGVLGDVFTAVLQYIQGAPRLPVQKFPRDFVDFVIAHDLRQVGVWSAYPNVTVIDILQGVGR
jgi:hypothetical protein